VHALGSYFRPRAEWQLLFSDYNEDSGAKHDTGAKKVKKGERYG